MGTPLRTSVKLGVVPTHLKFVGGLVPDESGRLPRAEDGRLLVTANLAKLTAASPVEISCAQFPHFPGVDPSDTDELINSVKDLGLEPHLILMVGGADPMDPADEDAVVNMLAPSLKIAKDYGIANVSSTSIEEWMKPGATPKRGDEFDAAVAQNVRVHTRAAREAGVVGSCVKNWHIEFLRSGEMQTFTDAARCWAFVKAANAELGTTFFKVLVDAAHCGDSDLSIPENEAVIAEMGAAGELGIYHASAKTTRGCLSTDDGWIAALLTAAAKTGTLEHVFVEVFHHEDPALEGLRAYDPGHGLDTTDGRDYDTVVLDGVIDIGHRLNNLTVRGVL
jgi:hypothetical protein